MLLNVVCKAGINVQDFAFKDFFVMMNVSSPIAKLIEANSEYYNYILNEKGNEKGCIRNIYNGKQFREFVKNLNELDLKRYATVTFNADGAPLLTSSTYCIWPIYLIINELPMQVRSKELILVGLWFGKDKRNMTF